MGKREDAAGCCAPGETPRSYEESVELGNRRRTLLIRFSAVASALLCLAGLLTLVVTQSTSGKLAGDRLLWVAALFGAPLLLGYARQLLATRRLPWQLIVAVGLLVIGVLGYPMVPAVVVALTLGTRTLRPARPHARPCPDGCTQDCCTTTAVNVGMADTRRAG